MNFAYSRSDRVAELIHREVAQIILEQINDPRLRLVNITKVKLSPDLRVATIFVSAMTHVEDHEQILWGLRHARKFIRGQMGRTLKLRRTPELIFKWDDSVDYSIHITEVIADLKQTDGDVPEPKEDE